MKKWSLVSLGTAVLFFAIGGYGVSLGGKLNVLVELLLTSMHNEIVIDAKELTTQLRWHLLKFSSALSASGIDSFAEWLQLFLSLEWFIFFALGFVAICVTLAIIHVADQYNA